MPSEIIDFGDPVPSSGGPGGGGGGDSKPGPRPGNIKPGAGAPAGGGKSGSDRGTGRTGTERKPTKRETPEIEPPFGLGELGAKPVGKGGEKRPEYRVLAQATIVTAFNAIEVWTNHPHWHKECEDVEPIVGPLCRMIESLPKSTLKAFEKRFNGLMLLGGTCALVVPDVIVEVRTRNAERAIAKAEKEHGLTPGTLRLVNSQGEVISSPGGHPETDDGQRPQDNGVVGWNETLPPSDLVTAYKFGSH